MERLAVGLAVFAGLASSPVSAADMSGTWKLTAKVKSFGFMLHCRLVQTGEQLSGVCTDMATNDPGYKPQAATC